MTAVRYAPAIFNGITSSVDEIQVEITLLDAVFPAPQQRLLIRRQRAALINMLIIRHLQQQHIYITS